MAKGYFLLNNVTKKLGSMVFSRKNGEQIIRARAESIRNPQTDAQALQRSRMAAVVEVYRMFNGVVYKRLRIGRSHFNEFVSVNLKANRPEQFGSYTPSYDSDYEKMIPPMPLDGVGAGRPVFAPYVITNGNHIPIPWIITAQNANNQWSNWYDNNLLGTMANGATTICPVIIFKIDSRKRIYDILAAQGLLPPTPPSATITYNLDPTTTLRAIMQVISGNPRTHIGLLVAYATDSESVFKTVDYNELYGKVSGTMYCNVMGGQVLSIQGAIYTQEGKRFWILTTQANINGVLEQTIAFFCQSMTANYNRPTAATVILSRRDKGKLITSYSQLALDNDAAQWYEVLFEPEIFEKAIRDFQRKQGQTDGLNLELI